MKYQYVVILKKTGQRTTDVLSIGLCLISAIVFLFLGSPAVFFHTTPGHSGGGQAPSHPGAGRALGNSGAGWGLGAGPGGWLVMIVGLVLLIGLGIAMYSLRRNPVRTRFRYLLLLSALGWFSFTPAPWMGVLFIVLVFLEHQTRRPLEIGFDQDRIVINTLFRQQFEWNAFSNIILKHGLLTLDFKNNRLIQREVTEDDEDDDADEEEFNAYCRTRLAAADELSRT